ncbi:MAG TPA: TlpA disulfide reductase family protein [Thermoanaerobaculia bacterium]|nr:TlpA disulfide reductase family protein [Thermoanaerobaculia bacterium]
MESSAAPRVRFRTTEGAILSTADVVARGHGLPTLLAFFKTSCPICQLTWPYLERLHRAYGGKAVHVVGVSQNDAASSRAYYAEHGGATFDLLLDPEPAFAASNAFDVESVPHLVLLSPEGLVEDVFAGWSKARMEALGARFAAKDVPFVPVVPPGDPVRDSSPG